MKQNDIPKNKTIASSARNCYVSGVKLSEIVYLSAGKAMFSNALKASVATVSLAVLAGCNFAPPYQPPQGAVPSAITSVAAQAAPVAGVQDADAPALQWLQDARLRQTVALALHENRDLRVAVQNVDKARAQYGIARADQLPTIAAQLQGQRGRNSADMSGGTSAVSEQVSASIGFASYEVDLWGRIRNLKEAAWQQFLQVQENRRGVEIALVAEVANAWLTLAADQERLALARQTLEAREQSYALMRGMFELGAASGLALAQNLGTVEAARGDVAQYTAQLARSRNALQLLVGTTVSAHLLPPAGWLQAPAQTALQAVPQALPSSILLARQDVQAAEHALMAQHAQIGAARAAFFPSISLTASTGSSSTALDDLFTGTSRTWNFSPGIRLPIFAGGRLRAGLQVAQANQRIAVAEYEKTVQTAFREVADVLADRDQWGARLGAQNAVVLTASKVQELSQARFDAGADDFLAVLDARRSLYAAQQTQISLQLAEQQNRITLWKVLGGQALPAVE